MFRKWQVELDEILARTKTVLPEQQYKLLEGVDLPLQIRANHSWRTARLGMG